MCTFKNLEEFWKTWKKFEKMSGNPESNHETKSLKLRDNNYFNFFVIFFI